MALIRGSADFLDVPNPHNHQYAVLREYLIQQGDRAVHFSGYCCELASTPVVDAGQRKFLSWAPLQRTLLVTSHAIMYVPRTTEQSGIFFDCRLRLDDVAQAIVLDSEEYGPLVQLFVRTADAPSAVAAASPFPNLAFPGQRIAVTLLFSDVSVRKSMLMALCSVRPQLPILQKKPVAAPAPSATADAPSMGASASATGGLTVGSPTSGSASASPRTPRNGLSSYDAYRSPLSNGRPQRPDGINASTSRYSAASRGSGRFPQAASFGTLASYAALAASNANLNASHSRTSSVLLDESAVTYAAGMSDEAFRAERSRLHDGLLQAVADINAVTVSVADDGSDDTYDAKAAAARPPEEDPSRSDEREAVRAMLEARERKMGQHIEFRMRYPAKAPTRVQPGVEYDKAHEERRILPDGHADEELLGPSLAPLWGRWKANGGLDGLAKRSDASRRAAEAADGAVGDEWSVFDSNELIDALKAREEIVYGHVGPKSQARLQRMRELVQRELHMHRNKAKGDRVEAFGGRAYGSSRPTVPVPFSLSQSPVTLRRMKMVDADRMIGELRQRYDQHQLAVHQIRKAQLQREVQRAQGE